MIITYLLIGVGFMFLTVLSNLLLAKVKFQDYDEIVANYETMPMMRQVAKLLLWTLAWPILVVVNIIYVIYKIKEMRTQQQGLFLFFHACIFIEYSRN